ncbi:MAG TPA: hypothetical protein VIG37_02270 [Methylomirabilota bacterium]|jgi:hypothetical protein
MSRARVLKRSDRRSVSATNGRRGVLVAAGIVLAVAILAILFALRGGDQRVAGADPGLAALTGRWLRLDGGYVLEIRVADSAVEATYLNPRPINVARAEAMRQGSTVKLFVELRAPGYPGSTYTLSYNAKRDELSGEYFQAALGQTFPVSFQRMK